MKQSPVCIYGNRLFFFSFFQLLLLTGCSTSAPVKVHSNLSELEYIDEVIPLQQAGQVSNETIAKSSTLVSGNSSKMDMIDFEKVKIDYPLSTNIRLQIVSIQFSGQHEEIWSRWNQQVQVAVEKIKRDLRSSHELLTKLNSKSYLAQNNKISSFKVNRIEIEHSASGYLVNFISQTPNVENQTVELKLN